MDELRALSAVLAEIDGETFESLEGRMAFQKRIYLAEAAGIRLGYRFRWNQFGPHSPRLAEDGRRLALAGTVRQKPRRDFTPAARAAFDRYRRLVRSPFARIDDGAWLELLSSMHYLRRHGVGDERHSSNVKSRLSALKPSLRLQEEVLEEAWVRLDELAGELEPGEF